MADVIQNLQIQIGAKANEANDAIDNLVRKLDRLTASLGKIDGMSLRSLANGVERLGTAMQSMNTVKTADFTRLGRNLEKLGQINTASVRQIASSMSSLAGAMGGMEKVTTGGQTVSNLASSLAKLGYKSVDRAIANIPQLAQSLNVLMATLSKAPNVSSNIIQMTNALANLASQGASVGSASRSIANSLNGASASSINASRSFSSLNNVTSRASKSTNHFRGLASSIGKFYATYFMAIRGVKKVWSSIVGTTDYIEAYNYFNVALGKIGSDWKEQYKQYGYDNAEAYADSFRTRLSESLGKLSGLKVEIGANGKGLLSDSGMKSLGLNIQEITQYASQLASVTNSMNMSGESSLEISKNFTRLAGDISSLFNVDYNSVAKNFQSAILGQSRAVYKYGIDITQATLQQYAYNIGLEKSVKEMTQGEKAQLRYIAILDQSKVSWGDLANTIESPNNQLRMFKTNLKETGTMLGQLFIPMLSKVLPVLNGVSIAFKRLLSDVAGFLNIKLDLDSFGQGYTDLDDTLEDNADSFEEATSKAKEYQNQLLGFDEINKLTDNSSSNSDSSIPSGNIDLTNEIKKASDQYEKVWNEAYKKMNSNANAVADKIYKAFTPLKNIGKLLFTGEMKEAGTELAQLINKGITKFDWGNVGTYVGKKITGTFDFIAGFSKNLNWKAMATSLTSFLNNAIKNIKPKSVANAINGVLNGILEFIDTVLATFDWGKFAKTIGGILRNLDWSAVIKAISYVVTAKWFINFGKNFVSSVSGAISGASFSSFGTVFSSKLSGVISGGGMVVKAALIGWGVGNMLAEVFEKPLSKAYDFFFNNFAQSGEEARKKFVSWKEEGIEPLEQSLIDLSDSLKNFNDELINGEQERQDLFDNADEKAKKIENLAGKYLELYQKENKTVAEEEKLNYYYEELIKLDPSLKKILDDKSGGYKKLTEEIEKTVIQLKEEAEVQAAKENATKVTEDLLKVEKQLSKYSEAQVDLINEELAKRENLREAFKKQNDKVKEQQKLLENIRKEIEENPSGKLEEDYDKANEELKIMQRQADNLQIAWQQSAEKVGDIGYEYLNLVKKQEELEESRDYWLDVATNAGKADKKIAKTNKTIDKSSSSAKTATSKIKTSYDSIPSDVKKSIDEAVNILASGNSKAGKQGEKFGKSWAKKMWKGMETEGVPTSVLNQMKASSAYADKFKTTVPALANGAVLKPNKPFLAVVGDQTSGTNIEAPLSTIKQGLSEVLGDEFKDVQVATMSSIDYTPAVNSTSYSTSVGSVYSNSEEVALLRQQNALLSALLQKETTVISADSDGIFKMVQKKANNYTKSTGNPAFLV